MRQIKILRNVTQETVTVMGRQFSPGESKELLPHLFLELMYSSEVKALVSAGVLVVNNGTSDLSVGDGIDFLERLYDPNPWGSRIARTWQATFSGNGSQENKWQSLYGTATSDEAPLPVPWDCHISGLSFSNKKCDVDVDIEIYVAAAGTGSSPLIQAYVWPLRNVRIATKVVFPTPIVFGRGDKIGVFYRKVGDKAEGCSLTIHFQIESDTLQDKSENFCSDFIVGGS